MQPSNAIKLVLELFDSQKYWRREDLTKAVLEMHSKNGGVEGVQKPDNVLKKILVKLHAEKKIEQVARGMWTRAKSSAVPDHSYQESDFSDPGDDIDDQVGAFNENHINIYQKNVGKPLNLVDERGNKYVPSENREAQIIIKDAHRLVKVWAQGIRDRLFPNGTNPDKTVTATNQRGNFRDYLPQTFEPSADSPSVISYWVYLWSDRTSSNNEIYFRITLGVNEDKADLNLRRKVELVRNEHGGEERFTAQLPALEGVKMSMDELIDWGVSSIKNFPVTYDEFCEELEPELTANEHPKDAPKTGESNSHYWIEKTLVKGRPDREYGSESLGQALWSPQKSKGERQADIYANMRKVQAGDVIFHFTDNKAITGISIATESADDTFKCLNGTDWEGLPGYRIALKDYRLLDKPITREEIFSYASELEAILASNNGLFYNKDLNLVQGGYLTAAPLELVELFNRIYRQSAGENIPYITPDEFNNQAIAPIEQYGIDNALNGVLLSRSEFEGMIDSIKIKKNLILQGPPGTGKSFIAKRLAYTLLGSKDDTRIQSVQFHQSFSYEDFIQGFRPKKDSSGFALRNGVFYRFCQQALQNPSKPYVFLIDEINRGNLSKIFGEVMLLIESDKRGPDWAVSLTYSDEVAKKFYIPANVHILGMMNTADRSLAIVDYALRRRFVFKDIPPGFISPNFKPLLEAKGVDHVVIDVIQARMGELNKKIDASPDLGAGFMVGHSFFVPTHQVQNSTDWYNGVIRNEIAPLLREYWFDKKRSEVDQEIELLLIK
ncbi:AAA family ATPase [Polynucleobacter sp. MWH-UH23A]|uniref:AAA family ATPase n=1 Tax=Polynucleobacter sp. MWH-UH23A TaxID=1855613 RepID=UPI003364DDDE